MALSLAGCLALAIASCGRTVSEGPQIDNAQAAVASASSRSLTEEVPATEPTTSLVAGGGLADWSLEEEQTEYLWNLEHHSNVLVKHGFRRLVQALKTQDHAGLRQLFSTDFVGHAFAQSVDTVYHRQSLAAIRKQSKGVPSRKLDRDEIVSLLMQTRDSFSTDPSIRFDVKLLTPGDRQDTESAWMAHCKMRMWGDDTTGRPREEIWHFRISTARPTKQRMSEPAWIAGLTVEQVAESHSDHTLFRDVTAEYNVNTENMHDNWQSQQTGNITGGVFACDFNRDACIDLLVTDVNRAGNVLLRGQPGGGFEDVTDQLGLAAIRIIPAPSIDAAFVDLDNDGWEDLVFSRGNVWRNVEGTQFVDVTGRSNFIDLSSADIHESTSAIKGICVADYDRDGMLDLYVIPGEAVPTSWLEDTATSRLRNLLLRNLGDWQFEDVTDTSGTVGGGRVAFTALWFDANNDLWPDLYVINEFGDGVLYVNHADRTFVESGVDPGSADFGTMGASCGDIDNDGNVDLYLGSMYSKAGSRVIGNLPGTIYPLDVMDRLRRLISGSQLYQNRGDLTFAAMGQDYQVHDVGWAYGPALADFDNDGFLDIYSTAGYMSRERGKPDG